MKRQALLFIAGGMMALASCSSETSTTTNNEMSQASIDSAVNARVEEMRMELMMQNDSLINEMALYKADSMCAAMKGQAPKPRTTASKPATNTTTTQTGRAAQIEGTTGNRKDDRFNDKATNTDKKEDRFNDNPENSAKRKEDKLKNR
ncbi:MAG: hypothetical protein EOP56_03060 [Sphingobacteriales bacterium]|nr:MAG: hypothetical protein EOP56_03060 [Sphingobacteriales bacterium]